MSMESQIDYAAVLEDLENDRAELEALIAYIKRKKLGQGMDIQITPGTGSMKSTGMRPTMMRGTTIAQDAFFSLGLIDAAKKYLAIMKAPKSAREIADALRAGGFNTTSKDFNNTVFSVLSRENKQDGGIVKVNTGWGLPEWYPGLKRGKSVAPSKISQAPSMEPSYDDENNEDQKG